jgi:hypothetical protein
MPYLRGPGVCRQCLCWKIHIYSNGLCESCYAKNEYDKQKKEEMREMHNKKYIDKTKFF